MGVVGTDLLPALALGAEPPDPDVLDAPPSRGHLIDRRVLARAFGVLGPVEAVVEMAAFVAVFVAAGWRPGDGFTTGATLLAASGAAFTAVVLGQAANAVACRSETRPAWCRAARRNPLMPWANGVEVGILGLSLFVAPLAGLLGQAPPSAVGWVMAALAVAAVLVADGPQAPAPDPATHRSGR